MISIVLCDDSEIILNKYKSKISKFLNSGQISYNLQTFTSGESLLFHMEEKENEIDIIYLDIEMNKTTGLEVAKIFRNNGFMGEIIFLTSWKEYVFDCFDFDPLHYIIKDNISDKKFHEILLKAISECSKKNRDYFTFESGGIVKRIAINLISYFEVKNRIVTIHYENTTVDFYCTMEKLQENLSETYFVRCHRSYIINLKYISEIGRKFILTLDDQTIPIGKTYIKYVHSTFSAMLSDF